MSDETANESSVDENVQLNSSRQLPQDYRRALERHLLSRPLADDRPDEETDSNNDADGPACDEIIHQLNLLSLDQAYLFDLIVRTVTRISSHLNGSRKLVSELHDPSARTTSNANPRNSFH